MLAIKQEWAAEGDGYEVCTCRHLQTDFVFDCGRHIDSFHIYAHVWL